MSWIVDADCLWEAIEPGLPDEGPLALGNQLPSDMRDALTELVTRRTNEGYAFVGKVRVNAESSEEGDDAVTKEAGNGFGVSWMMHPVTDETTLPLRKGLLYGLFSTNAKADKLDFFYGKDSPDDQPVDESGMLPNVLMDTGCYRLIVDRQPHEHAIHPGTLEGAGEIRFEHGYRPLLMLALVRKRLKDEFGASQADSALQFVGMDGELLEFNEWSDISAVIEQYGFDPDQVRQDAEAIGLVAKLIRLNEIEVDNVEDCFF